MKLYVVASNRHHADHFARQTLKLHRDEYRTITRSAHLLQYNARCVLVLAPDYHKGLGQRGVAEMAVLAKAFKHRLLHWRDDAAAIAEAIASYRASLAE